MITAEGSEIRGYSQEQAIEGLLRARRLDERKKQILKVKTNGLLDL